MLVAGELNKHEGIHLNKMGEAEKSPKHPGCSPQIYTSLNHFLYTQDENTIQACLVLSAHPILWKNFIIKASITIQWIYLYHNLN